MSDYRLSDQSLGKLIGTHPDLINVTKAAILVTKVDFVVLEGKRSIERQRILVEQGASQTMNSRHITGHAVDLGAWAAGQVDWSWPLYKELARAMKTSANALNIQIEWGGDWRTFKDGPHFQLPWSAYSIKK